MLRQGFAGHRLLHAGISGGSDSGVFVVQRFGRARMADLGGFWYNLWIILEKASVFGSPRILIVVSYG